MSQISFYRHLDDGPFTCIPHCLSSYTHLIPVASTYRRPQHYQTPSRHPRLHPLNSSPYPRNVARRASPAVILKRRPALSNYPATLNVFLAAIYSSGLSPPAPATTPFCHASA